MERINFGDYVTADQPTRTKSNKHYMTLDRNKENADVNLRGSGSLAQTKSRKSQGYVVKRNKCFSPNFANPTHL